MYFFIISNRIKISNFNLKNHEHVIFFDSLYKIPLLKNEILKSLLIDLDKFKDKDNYNFDSPVDIKLFNADIGKVPVCCYENYCDPNILNMIKSNFKKLLILNQ